jgi:hypothetical protein
MKLFTLILFAILISSSAFADMAELQKEWPKTALGKSKINPAYLASLDKQKDAIEPISSPQFATADKIDYIKTSEPVITLEINGDVRAYPLRIMIWHEIVNDIVGGVPVAITYSPLSNSSIVFERKGEFGSTGQTYKSNTVMYDKETMSWWQQYTGAAISGAKLGTILKKLPSRVESLELFKKRFPEGKVMVPPVKATKSYGASPYAGYDTFFPFFYKGKYSGKLPAMTYVVVVADEAWPLPHLMIRGFAVKGNKVIKWVPDQNSVLNSDDIDMGNDMGNIIVQERAANGTFSDIPYIVTFAFVFDAFQPKGLMNME